MCIHQHHLSMIQSNNFAFNLSSSVRNCFPCFIVYTERNLVFFIIFFQNQRDLDLAWFYTNTLMLDLQRGSPKLDLKKKIAHP